MIRQHQPLPPRPQRLRDPLPLRRRRPQHHPPILRVHRVRVPIKVAHILINHIEPAGKRTPRLAVPGVRMTRGIDVGAGAMQRGVDEPAGRVGRAGRVAREDFAAVGAAVRHQQHVGGFEQAEVDGERVGPEGVRVFRVPDGHVPG